MKTSQAAGLLVTLEGAVALGAWAGTIGFTTGDFDSLVAQLPWTSRDLAAGALGCCIALPTTITTVALLRRRDWAPRAALLTAGILAAWLVGQTAFVGVSGYQPVFLLVAGAIAALAVRPDPHDRDRRPLSHPSYQHSMTP